MANIPERGRLSKPFKQALTEGKYASLIKCIFDDKKLNIQVRDNYLNVYYRGGNILRITPKSFYFDKFYFYNQEALGFPKTYVLYAAQGGKIPKEIPTQNQAKEIIAKLESKEKEIKGLLPDNPKEFFKEAKKVMDVWFDKWHHKERDDQQIIASNNKQCIDNNDLAVIDIEFAVSKNKSYNKIGKNCRFDIIAVDRHGQIYVIELKENEAADSKGNSANVTVHREDFNNTIGKDSSHQFAQEMKQVIETKQLLGILPSYIKIDTNLTPEFAVAFSGKNAKAFNDKYKAAGIRVIEVNKEDKKLKLQ